MRLKNKLVIGIVCMLVLAMACSIVAAYFVIRRQTRAASGENLKRAIHVIRAELSKKKEDLLSYSRHLSTAEGMGAKIKYLYGFKKQPDPANAAMRYLHVSQTVLHTAMAADLWKLAVYDVDGDLKSFAVRTGEDTYRFGYCHCRNAGADFRFTSHKKGEEKSKGAWQKAGAENESGIGPAFPEDVPKTETAYFMEINGAPWLVALAPVTAAKFNLDTGETVKRQFGFTATFFMIGQKFAKEMSGLTGMKIEVFDKNGGNTGDTTEYGKLAGLPAGGGFNDVVLKGGEFLQGIIPLNGKSGPAGAIAILRAKDVARANTGQMVRILMSVYAVCGTLIAAVALFFAHRLTKPFGGAIATLDGAAGDVSSASKKMSSATRVLAEGVSGQATALEKAAFELEAVSSSAAMNAENAEKMSHHSKNAGRLLMNVQETMRRMGASMAEISDAGEQATRIIKTIDDIAFQTNLLALNASVEAARAGEQGAGFAVVAGEVGNLAGRAAESAGSTSELVEDIVRKIENGAKLAEKMETIVNELNTYAGRIHKLAGAIASGSAEQSRGVERIDKSLDDVEKVIRKNATGVDTSAAVSEDLYRQAMEMLNVVRKLMNLAGGNAKSGGKT